MDAQTLLRALGGEWRGQGGLAPCPVCQPERRADQRALSVCNEGGRVLAFCHKGGCNYRDILNAAGFAKEQLDPEVGESQHANAKRAAYEAEQFAKARRLWSEGQPIVGTKGEDYLRARGITCRLPASLRWVDDTYHGPSGQWLSAIVADVSTGGVHRTFFDKSGVRIRANAKRMLGPCAGGAVTFSEADGPLVVAEGLETSLSLLCGLVEGPHSVWATLSTSGMKGLNLPPRPGVLIVATDGDNAGRVAGNALAERAAALGWQVSLLPAPDGQDWNDVLTQKSKAGRSLPRAQTSQVCARSKK